MNKLSSKIEQAKTAYKNNLWQGRLILAASILLLVLVIARIALPYTIVYSAVYWLSTQDITSQIEGIDINVRKGTFAIINATGTKDGKSVFNIGKASIDWEWTPLSTKTIRIQGVILEDFSLDARKYTDALVIGGIEIKQGDTIEQPPAEEEQTIAWGTALDQIDFKNLSFCYQQYSTAYADNAKANKLIDYCGNLDLMSWQGDFGLGNTGSSKEPSVNMLTVDGALQIKQLSLFNNLLEGKLVNVGTISLPDINIKGINNISLDSLNIADLWLLQNSGHSTHKHAVELSKLGIAGIYFNNTDTLDIKSIELDKPVISVAKNEDGSWRFEQWIPQIEASPSDSKDKADTKKDDEQTSGATVINLSLGNIKISDSEMCYEDPSSASDKSSRPVDYCMNMASTEWKGNISVSTPTDTSPLGLTIKGDVVLSKFITTNNHLQRDLLTFNNLAVTAITVNSVDDLAFGKFELDKVTGLELTNTEDKHTVTVSSVDLSAFSYRNHTLAIDKVAVNDLGLELTQNEDGTLDFEKWKIESAEPQASATTEAAKDSGEPLKIKLGEFSFNTKQIVEFTDMSVTPTMHVGLKEIHVNIKNLDSEKPKQKSPIELSAKTTRHGTIDIKGTAMPFDSKPSFDAKGKITGLDLRAASPRAEQAIGHTIKSGQMDADLTLLSEQGQLDSKIALVLHHFNLKAKSKEDAAALDKKFGMPINQSLMLLKDKSDTIKLTIPITGDIYSPAFNPTDAIIKATAKATTVTLITFYTPYGLAYAGGNLLFNMATAMDFDPILFDAGSSQLTDTHKDQLAKLTELLTERPGIHLTLCGITNLGDREKITTEIINKEKIKPLSAERLKKLHALGSERQQNVKNHLINTGNIAHDRLILCAPEHNDSDGVIAGVEISI